jgi:hypothetical protein
LQDIRRVMSFQWYWPIPTRLFQDGSHRGATSTKELHVWGQACVVQPSAAPFCCLSYVCVPSCPKPTQMLWAHIAEESKQMLASCISRWVRQGATSTKEVLFML